MKRFLLAIACGVVAALSQAQSAPAAPGAPVVATIDYAPSEGGFLLFSTNDVANCRGGNGPFEKALGSVSPLAFLEMEIAKDSGKSGYMYGIYFCRADAGHFYRLLLNTEGVYELLKCDGMDVRWWDFVTKAWVPFAGRYYGCYPRSPDLKVGLGAVNSISVVAVGSGSFDFYFNSVKGASFTDSSYAGGGYGCMTFVGTAKDEDFPAVPVTVRYRRVDAN